MQSGTRLVSLGGIDRALGCARSIADRNLMDCTLTENERPLYRVWLHSPSVFGTETETILAFKIARDMGAIPSRVLRVLRGVPGVDPTLEKEVIAFVEQEPTLAWVEGDGVRTISMVRGQG